jgi:hypothetical protein
VWWHDRVGISEFERVLRRIGDLNKGEAWKVANLSLKREVNKFAHAEKMFFTIRGLQEDEAHIYVGCRRKNHVYGIHCFH